MRYAFPPGTGGFVVDVVATPSYVVSAHAPGTVVSFPVGPNNNPWLNPNNAKVEDGLLASLAVPPNQTYDELHCTNFGFAIPSTYQIVGIQVACKQYTDNALNLVTRCYPIRAGVKDGSNFDVQLETTSLGWVTYGGSAFLFNQSWTPADINNSGFGVSIEPGLQSGNAYVDVVFVTVFAVPTGGGTDMLKQVSTATGSTNISTSSASYASTTTAVSITTQGTIAIVLVQFGITSGALNCVARVDLDSSQQQALGGIFTNGNNSGNISGYAIFTGLTPGAHVFTLQWAAPGGQAQNNSASSSPTVCPRVVTVLDIG